MKQQNRTRNVQLILRVTPQEYEHIKKKMALMKTNNFNAYARKILIDGYVIEVDLSQYHELAGEVNKIGVNINQIARIANETRCISSQQIDRLQQEVEQIWQLQKATLLPLLSPIRTTIGKSVDYICNPSKTENCAFVYSENCFPKTASVEFSFLLRQARAGGNTLGRHLIQSFSPDETTPEQAHEIGKKLAEQHLKGEYAFVMTTHVDRNHIHNHFVWCAVNLKTHNRYHSNKRSYHQIQDLSDSLCLENGLSVIEVKSGKRGKSRFEYDMSKQGSSYKEKLRIAIDNATIKANNFEEFLQLLSAQGYEIKQDKYLSFKHKDGERFTRAKTIGEDYTEERIRERIKTKAPVKQSQSQPPPSIRKLLDLSQDKFQNSKGLTHWGKIQNLKIMADTMNLLREKGLTDLSEFDRKFEAANTVFDKLSDTLKSTENRLKDLTELQKQLRIYGRSKEMYGKFQQSRNKDKFIRETEGAESDVMLHETAKRYLSAYQKQHGKVPKSAELKPLLATLQKEKTALYEQYKTAKAEQMELMKLHMNLQKILGKEQKQQEVDR